MLVQKYVYGDWMSAIGHAVYAAIALALIGHAALLNHARLNDIVGEDDDKALPLMAAMSIPIIGQVINLGLFFWPSKKR